MLKTDDQYSKRRWRLAWKFQYGLALKRGYCRLAFKLIQISGIKEAGFEISDNRSPVFCSAIFFENGRSIPGLPVRGLLRY